MPDKEFYEAMCRWNRKKSWENFWGIYHGGFTHYTIRMNPLWRCWRILKNTVSGKYKACEELLEKRFGQEGDGA